MKTIRLTMAQALLKFMANQYVRFDEKEELFVQGIFGIFGHGNVTGLGEALEFSPQGLTYYQGHNEQGMAHAATAFAKQKNRLGILACTSSIGPGALNMITAAATATTNRIPLLLLPGDVFSCRQPDPVLQQLEVSHDYSISVNDCFKPVSRYWDRISRPEQLMSACLNGFRVLTDAEDTGAVTLCLPQDVQAESYAYPLSFFAKRVWLIERPQVCPHAIAKAAKLIKAAKTPLIIAGGGIHYAQACEELENFSLKHRIAVAETQAGKSALNATHPMNLGGLGVTGSLSANQLAAKADLLLVIGSRLQDFTTASKWAFQHSTCQVIHLNVSRYDGLKLDGLCLKGDAKRGLEQLSQALGEVSTSKSYQQKVLNLKQQWQDEVLKLCKPQETQKKALSQTAIIGLLNDFVTPSDVIIAAAGSLPGDLHRLWRSQRPKDYHLEYAFSCMGYEVAAGLGVRLALTDPSAEVYVLVGDGSFLMLHSELLTAIQEDKKITVILFDNHGFQCIHQLQINQGSLGFGNEFRARDPQTNTLSGPLLNIDFCQYANALGAKAFYADSYQNFQQALVQAKEQKNSSVIVLPIAADSMSHGYHSWWRVAVASISGHDAILTAHENMQAKIQKAKAY